MAGDLLKADESLVTELLPCASFGPGAMAAESSDAASEVGLAISQAMATPIRRASTPQLLGFCRLHLRCRGAHSIPSVDRQRVCDNRSAAFLARGDARRLSSLSATPRNPEMPLSEDSCLSVVGGVEASEPTAARINSDVPAGWHFVFTFMSGLVPRIGAESVCLLPQ